MSLPVRVLSASHVLPDHAQAAVYSPSPLPDDGVVKLSFMDYLYVDGRAVPYPMRWLFFYEGDLPPLRFLAGPLRSSLATAVAIFSPLAGRLTYRPATDDVVVDCSRHSVSPGVRFVEAEFDGDVRRFASGGDESHRTDPAARLLAPELDATRLPTPVLAVQVTRTKRDGNGGGGVVVGVSVHRAVADEHSVCQFMAAWSALLRADSLSQIAADLMPPRFDRGMIRHPGAEELCTKIFRTIPAAGSSSSSPRVAPDQWRRRSFLLRAGDIESVKRRNVICIGI